MEQWPPSATPLGTPPVSLSLSLDRPSSQPLPANKRAVLHAGLCQPLPATKRAVLHAGHWKVVIPRSGARADVLRAADATPAPLSPLNQWQFACGQFGSAALVGLVGVQLVSFYLPPIDAATGERLLPTTFVSQVRALPAPTSVTS
eukprot:scaffold322527_cov33-Tisochrysis_lutea.AAC.6